MKQVLFTVFVLFCCFAGSAQSQYTKDAQGNFVAYKKPKAEKAPATVESLTKNAEISAAKYVDAKGQRHNVYLSKAGKVFIVVQSKTGNFYRRYLEEAK